MSEAVPKRKLIEVALPLEKINAEAVRDGAKRKNHPWRLHYWWARRKLPVGRAVLFAQLVDDPSSDPERFPTEEAQAAERARLHALIERLVVWENIQDQELFEEAKREILRSTDGNPPPILDPFAGGGTIPLEAQRLGLEAHASDLNPVAVLINKALIEIPPKFADQPPVFPGLAESTTTDWPDASGLAADVRAYGEWMRDEAEKRIGKHYPKAMLENGEEANVIAWIWARTVTCPNPACGIEMPLVRSWWLCSKKDQESYVVPGVVSDTGHPSGKRVQFEIGHEAAGPQMDGTKNGQGGICVACGSQASKEHIKAEGVAGRMDATLLAIVAQGDRRRLYLPATRDQAQAAEVPKTTEAPDQELGYDPRNLWTPAYGLSKFADLFTNRQLLALTTFSDLVAEVRKKILHDALKSGLEVEESLVDGGRGAEARADAVASYLGLSVSRGSDYMSSLVTWHYKNQQVRNVFARQAIPMSWDFLEVNCFTEGSGSWMSQVRLAQEAIMGLSAGREASATQSPAQLVELDGSLVSTDPPYYDNVGYSDLSDFYYVWLRRSLRHVHPDLFGTLLVPKVEELVANPYRQGGSDGAKSFFEEGFYEVFARAREDALDDFPITVYYAFKQSASTEDGEVSTGWETLLDGMIRAGWSITATWPFRTETASRMLSQGTNALASSVVLALRPRPDQAPTTDRRGLLEALENELPEALRGLEQGHIAPVDLPQAAIGPGMAVFSRYAKVVEADGSQMTVRSALARINEILDQVLNEQEGDFDPTTRFAIAWYRQHGYGIGQFGDANNLANARNTAVDVMARSGILTSAAGKVGLLPPAELPADYDPALDDSISAWEVLHHMVRTLESDGIGTAASLLAAAGQRSEGPVDAELVKELAFLLFSLAERNSWTKDALAFNDLATSWPDIIAATRESDDRQNSQSAFDLEDE